MDLIKLLYLIYQQHPVVTTDSRQCPAGSLFFALKGERFDGNQYAAEVLQKGCVLAVVDDATVIPDSDRQQGDAGVAPDSLVLPFGRYGRYFYVADVLDTLQRLAACHREALRTWQRPVPVIGITGTNGKTTTKELTYSVLSQKYNVLATQGNLNNQIGVPLTLLRIRPEHELAIVEMGANHPMDIADLCAIARPDFGLITNVGKAHLLGFGSFEGVIAAKTKLYESLRKTVGTVFIDKGNPYLTDKTEGLKQVGYADSDKVSAGTDESLSVRGAMLSCNPYLTLSLFIGDGPSLVVNTNLIGSYNLINVIAAATVGNYFSVPASAIKAAIEGYEPQNMRSQLVDLGHDNNIILDAYNANPTSMEAALRSFSVNAAVHKNLVLGDMRELGDDSQTEHLRVLRLLASDEIMIDNVLLVGSEFTSAFRSLSDDEVSNMAKYNVRCYADVSTLLTDRQMLASIAGTTLVKGSRGIQLEKVAELMKELFVI